MDPHITLTFGTALGRARTMRINNINPLVSDTVVRNAMNSIIGSNSVEGATGRINSIRRAAIIETEVIPVILPE